MTIDELNGLFRDMDMGKRTEDGRVLYHASCPCHPDRHRGLSILVKRDGDGQINGLKLTCQAGCSAKEIMAAAGLPEPEGAGELVAREGEAMVPAETVREMAVAMSAQMGALAEMLRVTNERMAAMEAAIRTLEKVTPQQAYNINKAIRERAAELCREYRMGTMVTPGATEDIAKTVQAPEKARFEVNREKAKALATAIRREVRGATGARNMQAVARCDYGTVISMIMDWDDYEKIQRIRKGGGAE